jgi:hypothetical protein
MTADELRAIMAYLTERVRLASSEADGPVGIAFDAPTESEMVDAGLDAEGVGRLLRVPWWDDMVADIVETPEMCEPDDAPEQVLAYARDVIPEYIRKRFPLNEE